MSTQTPLLNFLPPPGEQLCNLLPLNHDSLVSVLGLALGYLKVMHPVKKPRAEMTVTAHIITLSLTTPLSKPFFPRPLLPAPPQKSSPLSRASLQHWSPQLLCWPRPVRPPPPQPCQQPTLRQPKLQ